MARWLKLGLFTLGVAGLALATLPWWLGAVLRPVLGHWGVTYEHYEPEGYAHFRLLGAKYANAAVEITAKQLHAATPAVWLAQRLRGVDPVITAEGWLIQRVANEGLASPRAADRGDAVPSTNQSRVNGMPDLQAVLRRIRPHLSYWLPRVQLSAGEVRGVGFDGTIAEANWRNSILTGDDALIGQHRLAFVLTPTADGSFNLAAHTAENDGRLRLVWSGTELKGEAVLWDQPLQLSARFPAQGWLPAEASAVAANWRLPAARVKLAAPYAELQGDARLIWRDGTFDLSLNAKAAPAADDKSKAPPFEASATAHGNLHELTLTALHVDAPFATATLTAPVTFSLDRPLAAESARLIVQADLAKLPWLEARGKVQGTVTVSGDTVAARQSFELKFSDVAMRDFVIKEAQAGGILAWPQMELTELKVQLDETSSVEAHGTVDWQKRELREVALKAKLGPGWFARWLPAGASWSTAEVTATAEGPLSAPRHQGSLKLTAVQWPPLHPLALEASWQGVGPTLEISTRAATEKSSLELTGTLDPHGLQLTKLQFTAADQPGWQLTAPAQLAWSPAWEISDLTLAAGIERRDPASGPVGEKRAEVNPSGARVSPRAAASIRLKAKGGPDGFIELAATNFHSAWLQDWITFTGPGWQVESLQATGRIADRALIFDATLAAQIEMSPQPAQVKVVAHGDARGIELKDFKVVEAERVLTQATGRLPLVWHLEPTPHLSFDESAPLELSASTEPDSPLWAIVSAATGLELTKPTAKISLKGSLRQPVGELEVNVVKLGRNKEIGHSLPSQNTTTERWNPASGQVGPVPLGENPSGGRVPPNEDATLPLGTAPDRFNYFLPEFDDLVLALQFGRDAVKVIRFLRQARRAGREASGQVPMDDARWRQLWRAPAAFDWSKAGARVEITECRSRPFARQYPNFPVAQGRLSAQVELTPGRKFSGELHLPTPSPGRSRLRRAAGHQGRSRARGPADHRANNDRHARRRTRHAGRQRHRWCPAPRRASRSGSRARIFRWCATPGCSCAATSTCGPTPTRPA
jgi:hypothetical protein